MRCPHCKNNTKVTNKRENKNGLVVRRRRECLKCKRRFTTYEKIEPVNLVVLKKNGRKESFNREKLKIGIQKACLKRPITPEQVENAVRRIESRLNGLNTIKSAKLGDYVLKELKKIDNVAYVRFASIYKGFESLKSFKKEFELLKERKYG